MVALLIFKYNCHSCNTIHNTPWGRPFGIPIATFGLIGFVLILFLLKMQKILLASVFVIFSVFVSVILIFAQVFVLKTICPLCLISEICLILVWFLLYFQEKNILFRLVSTFLLILIMGSTIQFLNHNNYSVRAMKVINMYITQPSSQIQYSDAGHNNLPSEMNLINDNMNEVELNLSNSYVLFFSTDCSSCDRTLKAVSFLSKDKQPILVDVWIPAKKSLIQEKKHVQKKLYGINIDQKFILYDYKRKYSANVPNLVKNGKILEISKVLNKEDN